MTHHLATAAFAFVLFPAIRTVSDKQAPAREKAALLGHSS